MISKATRFYRDKIVWLHPLVILLGILQLTGCAWLYESSTTSVKPEIRPSQDKASYNKSYTVKGKTYYPLASAAGYKERGLATWYGNESGNRTASGETFNPDKLTAAHKTLPIPTKIKVTSLRNGKQVDVVVNDRGPFNHHLIDLSKAAAQQLGMQGETEVEIEAIP